MHGGTISSGRSYTFFVSGAYWRSCITSFSNTTAPGVVARFLPSSKAVSSASAMRPLPTSAKRFRRPRARLSPPVAAASFKASGLVAAKFAGEIASRYRRVKKRCFSRAWPSSAEASASSIT